MADKILLLAGSVREGSFNEKLRDAAMAHLREMGVEADAFDFRANPLPLFNQDLESDGYPQEVLNLKKAIQDADGVVLVCPEYNASLTPMMKNLIDWASREKHDEKNVWKKKPILLMSASPGIYGGVRGLYTVRHTMIEVQALVLSEQVAVGGIMNAFDDNGKLKDDRTRGFFEAALTRLVDVVGKLGG